MIKIKSGPDFLGYCRAKRRGFKPEKVLKREGLRSPSRFGLLFQRVPS
jgi:hypothetical protein